LDDDAEVKLLINNTAILDTVKNIKKSGLEHDISVEYESLEASLEMEDSVENKLEFSLNKPRPSVMP